jgi:homoserine dehydrogenase
MGQNTADPVLRIGLLGLGTVGSGVAEILQHNAQMIAERCGSRLQVVRALVRSGRRRRGAAARVATCTDPRQILEAEDIDVVVELMGGQTPARRYMQRALRAKKPVVTANKAVLALHGSELFALAQRCCVDIYFEGSVAGGIPIIRTLREALGADRTVAVRGLLNGTTQYMLGQLEAGETYADALAAAQRLGFAERDPRLDVSGRDAADKLCILGRLAFNSPLSPKLLSFSGIEALTPQHLAQAHCHGYRVRLLAQAHRRTVAGAAALDAWVHPALLGPQHPLYAVPAAHNAVAVRSLAHGDTQYQGAGAGSLPTGAAVVADLMDVARNLRAGVWGRLPFGNGRRALPPLPAHSCASAFFVSLQVQQRPGVLAHVANVFAEAGISLATVTQNVCATSLVPLTLTTHPTTFGAMQRALLQLRRAPVRRGTAQALPIAADS